MRAKKLTSMPPARAARRSYASAQTTFMYSHIFGRIRDQTGEEMPTECPDDLLESLKKEGATAGRWGLVGAWLVNAARSACEMGSYDKKWRAFEAELMRRKGRAGGGPLFLRVAGQIAETPTAEGPTAKKPQWESHDNSREDKPQVLR